MKRDLNILPVIGTALLLAVIILAGCGGGGGGGGATTTTTTPTAPTAFNLISPADGSTGNSFTPTFAWSDSTDETSYTLQIATDASFNTLVYENTGLAANTTSYALTSSVLSPGTSYVWRVKAVNATGTTTASNAPWTFKTLNSGASLWSIASNQSVSAKNKAYGMVKDANALYVVGYDTALGYKQWRIEKRDLVTGALVTGFGSGGIVSNATTTESAATAIALGGGYIYVTGYEVASTVSGSALWRIEKRSLSNGALETTTFGSGSGVVTSGTGTTDAVAKAIAIDTTYMYVAGYDLTPGQNQEWRIEKRSLSDGSLESISFGTGGVIQSHPSGAYDDVPYGIAVDASALYIVGSDEVAGALTPGWRIEKRNIVTGATLTTISESATAEFDEALAIAIDANYMYVVGYDSQTVSFDDQWRIEKRSLSDGSLVASFGTGTVGGVIQENPSAVDINSYDDALAIAIDANYMYVAGYDSINYTGGTPAEQWRIEKRSLSSGGLITLFGGQSPDPGGVVTSNNKGNENEAYAIVVDDNNIYGAGYDSLSSTNQEWRMEKRVK